MNELIILSLLSVIVIQQWLHAKERRDLYNRLMARDFSEYNLHQKKEKTTNRPNNYLKDNIVKSYQSQFED